jgi:uncharacterized membrane protein
MKYLVHDLTGSIHLFSSILALVIGSCVLVTAKGTRIHKRMGYAYALSMLALNATAFNLYHLFNRFGPFHIAAILSLLTLLMGILPAIFRKAASKSWLYYHVPGMYYSVIGLYAAFASEVLTRIPGLPFFALVFIATAMIMFFGVLIFNVKKKIWLPKK